MRPKRSVSATPDFCPDTVPLLASLTGSTSGTCGGRRCTTTVHWLGGTTTSGILGGLVCREEGPRLVLSPMTHGADLHPRTEVSAGCSSAWADACTEMIEIGLRMSYDTALRPRYPLRCRFETGLPPGRSSAFQIEPSKSARKGAGWITLASQPQQGHHGRCPRYSGRCSKDNQSRRKWRITAGGHATTVVRETVTPRMPLIAPI